MEDLCLQRLECCITLPTVLPLLSLFQEARTSVNGLYGNAVLAAGRPLTRSGTVSLIPNLCVQELVLLQYVHFRYKCERFVSNNFEALCCTEGLKAVKRCLEEDK